MKLNFTQRTLLTLYKAKISAVALVSKQKATKQIFNLFCTPHMGKIKIKQPSIFSQAQRLQLLYQNQILNGWHFEPQISNKKLIIILHGFNSCAYKSTAIIQALVNNNYEVIAYDAIAHGTSEGKILNAKIYVECVEKMLQQHKNIYAIIGHSLGGLTASLIAEKYNALIKKLILIAPATETTSVFQQFFEITKFSKRFLPWLENYVLQYSGKAVSYYSVSRALQHTLTPTLWIHDENDTICSIKDVLPVKAKNYKHIEFFITQNLGHNAIYRKPQVLQKVVDFLNQ